MKYQEEILKKIADEAKLYCDNKEFRTFINKKTRQKFK